MKARLRTMLVLAAVVAAPGCVAPRVTSAPQPTAEAFQTLISDRLYFGRGIPGDGVVSESDWEKFLSEVVTPRFPAGLSVWRAQGQWRDKSSVIQKEESFILDLLHPEDAKSEQSVREIMTDYKTRFKQEAVLRVRERVRVQFW
jgi:uncharacterized protein DUF3574